MNIRVVRSGGLAGLRRQRELDSGGLSGGERARLEGLVDAARFFELPHTLTRGTPDMIRYRVTVERAGAVHEVEVDDDLADSALLALIEIVLDEPGDPHHRP